MEQSTTRRITIGTLAEKAKGDLQTNFSHLLTFVKTKKSVTMNSIDFISYYAYTLFTEDIAKKIQIQSTALKLFKYRIYYNNTAN